MNKTPLYVFWIGLTLLVAGCAEPPSEELTAAQQAVDKANEVEAEAYATAEYQQATDALEAARAEIAAQDEAWFFSRDYSRAAELLKQAERGAEGAWVAAQNNRGQGRVEAEATLARAEEALAAAAQALQTAPTGKGTQADLDALRADLAAAEASMAEARESFEASRYAEANTRLNAVISKAESIRGEVEKALSKTRRGSN